MKFVDEWGGLLADFDPWWFGYFGCIWFRLIGNRTNLLKTSHRLLTCVTFTVCRHWVAIIDFIVVLHKIRGNRLSTSTFIVQSAKDWASFYFELYEVLCKYTNWLIGRQAHSINLTMFNDFSMIHGIWRWIVSSKKSENMVYINWQRHYLNCEAKMSGTHVSEETWRGLEVKT